MFAPNGWDVKTNNMVKKLLLGIKQLGYVCLRIGNYYYRHTYLFKQKDATTILAPDYYLDFEEHERRFMEQSAASFGFAADDYSTGYRQKELAFSMFSDVKFLSDTGAILLQNKLLVESVFNISRLASSSSYRDFTVLFPKSLGGDFYTSIIHGHWANNNIFHWFIDCLPRLYALVNSINTPVKLLMWKDAPAYQSESLKFLLKDYPNFEILNIDRRSKYSISKYIFPHFISNSMSGYLPPDVSGWMRENIWRGYGILQNNPKRRIYISRAKAKTRRVLNEQELLPILQKYDFEIVRPEEMTYQQQVQLFFDTEAVVAPHGAGLTNLLFSAQCKVLELHPADFIKPHYFLLCKGLGFEYHAVVGTVGDNLENYAIDVREVESHLDRITSL